MSDQERDRQLMSQIALKDSSALEQLYDQYEMPLYSFVMRMVKDAMLAEEIIQELFLRIWNHAERYDGESGKFTTWMFAIARNIAIDQLRKRKSRMPEPYADESQLAAVADEKQDIETEVEMNWYGNEMKKAIQELNEDQQDVVEMIYYQGYTQQEVSRLRDIPLGTVKSRVRLALRQLRKRLDGLQTGVMVYGKSRT
ncbi:RNA polymerase sigma factor [Paenibacillus sp. HB172176]|uniref:RNA polymerase sigma factor n=1 Tax=Paenibacillus sp. HB172176 TaxID=2493690 RepID=UPI001439ACCE|nr:RNA polymerase sigma factor [Paenibacillus sp. HB172176]